MSETTEKPLLHTEGLVKVYNRRAVVNGVDINVKKARSWGFSARTAQERQRLFT